MKRLLFSSIFLFAHPLLAVEIWDANNIVVDGWNVGRYTSLAILPTAQPAISYYDYIDGDLEYAWSEEGQWYTTTVDSIGDVGSYTNLKILLPNQPAISYFDATNNYLKYAWFNGIEWQTSIVDSEAAPGYTSMVILPSGRPAISYPGIDSIRYAWFDGVVWQSCLVDTATSIGIDTSIAILPCGMPAISYHNASSGTLKYAWFEGFGWYTTTVNPGKWEGEHTSLAFLPSGKPAISYLDRTNLKLMYAELTGEDPSEPSQWQKIIIDYDRNAGEYTSIAILPSGQPAISYYHSSSGDLKYALGY